MTVQTPEPDHFVRRKDKVFAGTHLLIDLYGASHLNDIAHIDATLRCCVETCRATLLHMHLHPFHPDGVSGVAVLAESHISIHTWPQRGFASLDMFMCGAADPHAGLAVLKEAFAAERTEVQEVLRGMVNE